LGATK
jgi:hypothetical protein